MRDIYLYLMYSTSNIHKMSGASLSMSGGPAGASDLVLTKSRIAAVAGGIILIGADITAIAALVSTNTASIITTNESLDATDLIVALKADQLTTYTKLESNARITNLANSAPATLDTLKEIADALGNDADLAGTLTAAIGIKPIQHPQLSQGQ